ncbi:MAG: enoyl-CoA hydratase-related protein [Chloroflexi bacterium]|nr:enoyl-CoA hydratase-related protein [Chloroflexota bacterium]MCY3588322.1 enoyl-CoA hydratase-related protein [Chloroflexota bacterium]MCY3684859.1 enoyl-CoA hydratase-related protein [Chloroflexota bacterium]MDE2708689.1 enoyl-CoA hydratase-related protein [Chloroflexota bacterium]
MQQLEHVPYLLYEKEDSGILWIKFNRPEKLNAAVGGAERTGTLAKVGEYMRAGDDDPDVKVIVLTGVGRGFCAGADVRGSDLGDFEPNDNYLGNAPYEAGGLDATRQRFYYGLTKLMRDISYVRKPTVAMVNGVAAGFGMDMALQCDIRYGSEKTRFIAYQQVGQIIENGGAYHLTRLAGLGRALEFSFTGHLDGPTAAEWGVLNRIVPSDELEDEVRALCARIMRNPPLVTWINKRVIRAAMDSTLETTAVLTSNASPILATSEDAEEARAALRERREPDFAGR